MLEVRMCSAPVGEDEAILGTPWSKRPCDKVKVSVRTVRCLQPGGARQAISWTTEPSLSPRMEGGASGAT